MRLRSTDEGAKAASYLHENLIDPLTGSSGDAAHAPFSNAFNFKGSIWDFFELPEQQYRQTRFDTAMEGVKRVEPNDNILKGWLGSALCRDAEDDVTLKVLTGRH